MLYLLKLIKKEEEKTIGISKVASMGLVASHVYIKINKIYIINILAIQKSIIIEKVNILPKNHKGFLKTIYG